MIRCGNSDERKQQGSNGSKGEAESKGRAGSCIREERKGDLVPTSFSYPPVTAAQRALGLSDLFKIALLSWCVVGSRFLICTLSLLHFVSSVLTL